MRVTNLTPYPQRALLWTELDGAEHCSLIVKAAAPFGGDPTEQGVIVRDADIGAEPADVAPRRTGTSVLVHAPLLGADARVRVGRIDVRATDFARVATDDPRRVSLFGTVDEGWRRTRAPLLPRDYRHEYLDIAPPALVARPFLRGGEPIELDGFAGGVVRTSVPRLHLRVRVGNALPAPMDLDLLQLSPASGRSFCTYRYTFDVSQFGRDVPAVTLLQLRVRPLGAAEGEEVA